MTIKQQGGIFGRNPTFNELNTDGDVSVGGDLSVATDVTISNGNLSITQSTPTIDLIDLQDVNDVAQIFSSAGSLDLKADINNDKGSSRIKFEIDGSEVGRWLAGGGLCFNGDTVAANALDDYEEGSWTPVISDANSGGNLGSASIGNANYTKIGRTVVLSASLTDIDTTGMTSANVLYIQGLPFTSAATNYAVGNVKVDTVTFPGSRTYIYCQVSGGHTYMNFQVAGSAISEDNLDVQHISSGVSDIQFSITYTAT